jgi:hypothetical protein
MLTSIRYVFYKPFVAAATRLHDKVLTFLSLLVQKVQILTAAA